MVRKERINKHAGATLEVTIFIIILSGIHDSHWSVVAFSAHMFITNLCDCVS